MTLTHTADYLSERLFHFWGREPMDADRAFPIFTSIAERGLLLSRGSGGLIDRFPYVDQTGQQQFVEIVQNARVCFTDIPEDKLAAHTKEYGRYAIGFSRRTVLEWGGCAVWYLPNHVIEGTLQDQSGAIAYGLADAITLLRMMPQLLQQTGSHLTNNGAARSPDAAERKINFAAQSVLRMSSFMKEMSSKTEDDHRYLYEREWRIVSGAQRLQPDGLELRGGFRRLLESEKAELVTCNPRWGEPLQSTDPRITSQFTGTPMIDDFWMFTGLPDRQTVAQAIEVVMVPDQAAFERVLAYVEEHTDRFRTGGPEIRILRE